MARRSIAEHHVDWLKLVDQEGPFLTLPVLCEAMPDGLASLDGSHVRRELRDRYEQWRDGDLAHEEWVDHVLTELLGHGPDYLDRHSDEDPPPQRFVHRVPEHGDRLAPTMVLRNPDDGPDAEAPQMLVVRCPRDVRGASLTSRVAGSRWVASPIARMETLLRETGVRLGLVTDGERWTLVDVPTTGDDRVAGSATWYAGDWMDEEIALRAFVDLLGQRRFFSLAEDETAQALLDRSRAAQFEVTDQLGLQVRRAVEILVRALDRADHDAHGELLRDIPERRVYEAATAVMMRLVVLLCAEERELLPIGTTLFDQHYAISTLGDRLRESADRLGEEVLERSYDAWPRLLAAFRAVFAGIEHDRLQMTAYGGDIFDPDRYPFLEGRSRETSWRSTPAQPIKIHNRTVLHVLEALQLLKTRVGGHTEVRRLTFRSLGVEQIGHVYEGLLDHGAQRLDEPVLGLIGTKAGEEAEVRLSMLEEIEARKGRAGGRAGLAKTLEGLKVGSAAKVGKLLDAGVDADRAAILRAACGDDESLWRRLEPYAALVRDDDLGDPLIVPAGSIFVTSGVDRRATGTHYTPRSLTEPIVERTLEPQVCEGPREGWERERWRLKSPRELLDLKVCDPACGSGAFLVAVVRYLADRLVESWAEAEETTGGAVDTMGEPVVDSTEGRRVPKSDEERVHLARRLVTSRCVYGVDKNPAAVEMAKLSLWLLVLAKDEPFGFLDHAIKSGDSLVGLSRAQIANLDWRDPSSTDPTLFAEVEEAARAAALRRGELEAIGVGLEDEKRRLHADAEAELADGRLVGDVVLAAYFSESKDPRRRERLDEHRATIARWRRGEIPRAALETIASSLRRGDHPLSPFHWELEFPEVFDSQKRGFDALVGNPPFLGGARITEMFGSAHYQEFLKTAVIVAIGHIDLSVFFLRRAWSLQGKHGTIGLIMTSACATGTNAEVGLRFVNCNKGIIYAASSGMKWPGKAAVSISVVHIAKAIGPSSFPGRLLDGRLVNNIDSKLKPRVEREPPASLVRNQGLIHVGTSLGGAGFVLDADRARHFLQNDKNRSVLLPLTGGEEVNAEPGRRTVKFVICFGRRSLDESSAWPELLAIVERDVRPHRMKAKSHGPGEHGKKYWWQHVLRADPLYCAVESLDRCIVMSQVSTFHAIRFESINRLFNCKCFVVASDSPAIYAVLQSQLHEIWSAEYSGVHGGVAVSYAAKSTFLTFPFPSGLPVGVAESRELCEAGTALERLVEQYAHDLDVGLTTIWARIHSPEETGVRVGELRAAVDHVDAAVLAAYGWSDIHCSREFVQVDGGGRGSAGQLRYCWRPQLRADVLDRLLRLNQRRFEEEVAQGLHSSGGRSEGAKGTRRRRTSGGAADPSGDDDGGLFDDGSNDSNDSDDSEETA